MKRIAFFGLLCALAAGLSCAGGDNTGSPVKVEGRLGALSAGASVFRPATIEVLGRGANEFPLSFDRSNPAEFQIDGLPRGRYAVFRMQGGEADESLSLPLLIDPGRGIELGTVPAGFRAALKAAVESPGGVLDGYGVDLVQSGMVLGVINPEGSGTCALSFGGVDLVDRERGLTVLVDRTKMGPFYFDNSGVVRASGGFLDAECSYVIFNVLPGLYRLKIVMGGGQMALTDIVILAGKATVPYRFPGL